MSIRSSLLLNFFKAILMPKKLQGFATVTARVLLAAIFLLSAVGNKIPQFNAVAAKMGAEGVPMPNILLVGAIVFLLAGSLSLITGFRARTGASLLLVFLVLATYYFHDFWTIQDAAMKQQQMISFMKNLALMGAMLFIIANGPGPMSYDAKQQRGWFKNWLK